VLAAARARAAAVVARDTVTLAQLLRDDLVYTHATGVQHDHDGLLQFVRDGPSFLAVALGDPVVRLHGEVAVLTGTLRLCLRREPAAEPVEARSLASAVWLREAGATWGWRLLLFQSTRLNA
jgi:ketosteroid isomerase-like protein